jgi:hypothetical protein
LEPESFTVCDWGLLVEEVYFNESLYSKPPVLEIIIKPGLSHSSTAAPFVSSPLVATTKRARSSTFHAIAPDASGFDTVPPAPVAQLSQLTVTVKDEIVGTSSKKEESQPSQPSATEQKQQELPKINNSDLYRAQYTEEVCSRSTYNR